MKKLAFLMFLSLLMLTSKAQQKTLSQAEINEYKEQITNLVTYLEETLNFIGDPDNTMQEKDIIFKESYTKIFVDDEVQIEDDLDKNRSTYINKDVQAYLKDIDFFFKKVVFKFNVKEITLMNNENGGVFFKVSMNRTLNGKTITEDTLTDTRNRFIEINIDPYKKDIKIASIYTTKFNEKEEQIAWWNSLEYNWRNFFGKGQFVNDSIEMSEVSEIISDGIKIDNNILKINTEPFCEKIAAFVKTTEINLENTDIYDLSPLTNLDELEILTCSGQHIKTIYPIRNLNKINELYIDDTDIEDISELRYANNIRILNAENTPISDISVFSLFGNLSSLSLSNTDVKDFSVLADCQNLQYLDVANDSIYDINFVSTLTNLYHLDISGTFVTDLQPLENLENLQYLNIDNTDVTTLSPISNLVKMNELWFNNTLVKNLDDLNAMTGISKIYCDNTSIDEKKAQEFINTHPLALVIYESEALNEWWKNLDFPWRKILSEQCGVSIEPTTEELHKIISMKRLEVNVPMQSVTPVSRLTNLEYLDLSKTKVDNINALHTLLQLKKLNIENTKVVDISVVRNFSNLQELNICNTGVASVLPLLQLSNIKTVYADGSKVTSKQVFTLRENNPQMKIIYQTAKLTSWWGLLSEEWHDIFCSYVACDKKPTAEQLQAIVDLEVIVAPNRQLQNLEPLAQLHFLKELVIDNNYVSDLTPLAQCPFLTKLSVAANPILDIEAISVLYKIENLNIEGTPIKDLSPVEGMYNLKTLNISGTSISKLKVLANHNKLEDLSIANTNVKDISPIADIPSLKYLKAFNSRVKQSKIDELRNRRPDLNILYY